MKKRLYLVLISTLIIVSGCKKDWLEAKNSKSLIVPTTLADMRLLMNMDAVMAQQETRGIIEASSDDYYTDPSFTLLREYEKRAYVWAPKIFEGESAIRDWDGAYEQILYCNVVLEGMEKIERTIYNEKEYDAVKGTALFHRAKSFLNLALTFSKQYDPQTAATDLCVPLKLTPDVTEKLSRASVKEVYDKIIADLETAIPMLPVSTTVKTDPTQAAGFGLLARCYLFMRDYEKALTAANASYNLNGKLFDFNSLNPNLARPFSGVDNVELLYFGTHAGVYGTFSTQSYADSTLFSMFADNDLRKTIYYLRQPDGGMRYRGSFTGTLTLSMGVCTDEVLLIRAECKARGGDVSGAMSDLNTLLQKRFKVGTYIPVVASGDDEALQIILIERRKELLRRGLRWPDLKRLNKESRFAVTLTRKFDGKTYALPPNDPRYVMPLPDYIINQHGFTQNSR